MLKDYKEEKEDSFIEKMDIVF